MSDTILSGDFTVYYLAETRQKRIVWTGLATGTRTVNQLYSAMADLLDELGQMDDGSALSAQTPTEYTIGIIDPSDKDPWFIDRTSAEHLTGGALKTASWKRDLSGHTNCGVMRVAYTVLGNDFIAGDIGKPITNGTSSCSGTLLDYNTVGATKYLWVRPTDATASHDWTGATGTVTVSGGTGNVTQAAAGTTGESIWSNVFSLGTIEPYTHIYVYQKLTGASGAAKLTAYKGTKDWWGDGHIDVLVNVKELDSIHDGGYITVLARQYSKAYGDYIASVGSGGRNPIPLATGGDLDNTHGLRTFTGTSGSGTFNVENWIYTGASWGAATKRAKLTSVGGTTGSPVLTYYLLGDLTDFVQTTDTVKEYTGLVDGDATCTAGLAADAAIPAYTITIVHANTTADINEDGSNENYSVAIDLKSTYSVAEGYEFAKYATRYGHTGTTYTDSIEGEQYIGADYRIAYTTLNNTVAEGAVVTQLTSGATGTVVAHHTGAKILILRNSRGTFNNTNDIQVDGSNYVVGPTCTAVAPIHAAPFGTFAGGTWFCAPGVALVNFLAGDANKFQLVDDGGTVRKSPTKVNVTVSNTRLGDRVTVFKLTVAGGVIEKTTYTNTVQSAGAGTVVLSGAIAVDTPGKTTGGVLRLVQGANEYRLRYASWAGSTFTLADETGLAMSAGSGPTAIVDSNADFVALGVKVGDLIRNTTAAGIGYVTEVTDQTHLVCTSIAGQASLDAYQINTLPVATTGADRTYVPLLDSYETVGSDGTPGSEATQVTYSADIPVVVRVRKAGGILPFETPSTVGTGGMSVATIRTPDSIYVVP